jgi:hypothetical protein
MQSRKKYFILLIFIMLVIGAMFFMYSTINSPEKYTYYTHGTPSYYERVVCVLGGGKMEVSYGTPPIACVDVENCKPKESLMCHYR